MSINQSIDQSIFGQSIKKVYLTFSSKVLDCRIKTNNLQFTNTHKQKYKYTNEPSEYGIKTEKNKISIFSPNKTDTEVPDRLVIEWYEGVAN